MPPIRSPRLGAIEAEASIHPVQVKRPEILLAAGPPHSVVIHPTVYVGGVQITEHFEGRRRHSLIWMASLIGLKIVDLLLQLAGDRLIPIGLSIGKNGLVGLKLISNANHVNPPLGYQINPNNLVPRWHNHEPSLR
jgi:hypothetical protein